MRREWMTGCFRRAPLAAAAFLACAPALGEERLPWPLDGDVSLGGQLMWAMGDQGKSDVRRGLKREGIDGTVDSVESDRLAMRLFGGLRYTEHFGVELAYTRLGATETRMEVEESADIGDFGAYLPASGHGVETTAVGFWAPDGEERYELHGRIGAWFWWDEQRAAGQSRSRDGVDLVWAGGGRYHLDRQWSLHGEVGQYHLDDQVVNTVAAGVVYHFERSPFRPLFERTEAVADPPPAEPESTVPAVVVPEWEPTPRVLVPELELNPEPVPLAELSDEEPRIVGEPEVGEILRVAGTESLEARDDLDVEYQWYGGGEALEGETRRTLVVTQALAGVPIALAVNALDEMGRRWNWGGADSEESAEVVVAERDEEDAPPRLEQLDSHHWVIRFDTGSADIREEFADVFRMVGELYREEPGSRVVIEGHTDSRGPADLNQRLSGERAEAAGEALRERDVPAEAIETAGHGEDRPVADEDEPHGYARNRRVELRLVDGD